MQKRVLDKFFTNLHESEFLVNYWDGTTKNYFKEKPKFTIKLNKPLPVVKMAADPTLMLGEAYMDGVIDIDGRLEEVVKWIYSNYETLFMSRTLNKPSKFINRLKGISLKQQKREVQYHYDIGNNFFSLWLDKTMSYSCAYFEEKSDTLEKAQLQKIDHTLKKLNLKPGESLLDIGCGWGWLAIRAAKHYNVRSLGITLSQEQFDRATQLVQDLGLTSMVDIKLLDHRELAAKGKVFDKIVSVGMLEHVGKINLPKFMASIHSLLAPGGLALVHSITSPLEGPVSSWIEKYIFPGGYIPSLRELVWLFPEHAFHVIDIESLRRHYAMTLDHWAERFERNHDDIQKQYGERFVRMWRLYLLCCAESFRTTGLDIHQILVSKGLNNNLPLTRKYVYQK